MSKIRYTVRLYRQHDIDLISFIMTHEFNVMKAIYSSLCAFAKGEAFVIEIPPARNIGMPELRRVYTKALILDSEKDSDAIALLSRIKPGYRNNFLKNLLRQYLCFPISEEFLENGNDKTFFDQFQIFRAGRRVVKAGKINCVKKPQKAESNSGKNERKPRETAWNQNEQKPSGEDTELMGIFESLVGN